MRLVPRSTRTGSLALVLATSLAWPLLGSACQEEQAEVKVKWKGGEKDAEEESAASTASGRAAYEQRMDALKNQPEPDVDPESAREQFELVWGQGEKKLETIYNERSSMLEELKKLDLDDDDEQAKIDATIEPLEDFGIGRDAEHMEEAPKRLCETIREVRKPAEALIEKGRDKLEPLQEKREKLEKREKKGKNVYQSQWDDLEEKEERWSAPVRAGKRVLLAVKSLLDEAHVLADHGPRETQHELQDCLQDIAEEPLEYDETQKRLEEVIERTKYYRPAR